MKINRTIFVALLSISIFVLLLFIWHLSWNRAIDPDEMESLSAASYLYNGSMIYRDFWQMHTPFFYYFLSPLFLFFTTMKIFYAGRLVMFLLLLINGFLVFIISKRLFKQTTAILSFLLYLTLLPVLDKMTEIRPDTLVVIFSNLSLIFLLNVRLSPGVSFFVSGVCGAFAILSKQSGIFFVMGEGVFLIVNVLMQNGMPENKDMFSIERFNSKNYFFFMLGCLLPCIIFILFLFTQGAYEAFIQWACNNEVLKTGLMLKTKYVNFSMNKYLSVIFYANFMIFILAGLLLMKVGKCSQRFLRACVLIFILLSVSLVGLYLTLNPWEQEFLLFSQYLVLLAAPMLLTFFEFIAELFQKGKRILSLFLLVSMIMLLCLPPLIKAYHEQKFNLRWRLSYFDRIIESTKKKDRCLSTEYSCPFRPSVYFYRLSLPWLKSRSINKLEEEILIDEILHQNIVVIVPSWTYSLMPQLTSLIDKDYVLDKGFFYIPGQIWSARRNKLINQDIIVDGYYRVVGWKGALIDKKPVKDGIIYLSKGKHVFEMPKTQMVCGFRYDIELNKE